MTAIVKITQPGTDTVRYMTIEEVRRQHAAQWLADAISVMRDQRPEFEFEVVSVQDHVIRYTIDEVLGNDRALLTGTDLSKY